MNDEKLLLQTMGTYNVTIFKYLFRNYFMNDPYIMYELQNIILN